MNEPKKSKNYATASGPVNRRTAAAPVAKPVVAQAVLQRVSAAQAKRRLGAPLSQRVAASAQPASAKPLPTPIAIVQAIAATVGATGLGLGVIQSSVMVMGGSAVGLAGVAAWVLVSRRARTQSAGVARVAMPADLAEPEALAQLDAAMEKMAAEAPQATVDSLKRLKESIVRCTALLGAAQAEGGMATEESLYLREAVRRYIPDSINSCLQVPQKDRATLVIDGSKPALDLLQDQLQMIQQQIDTREAKLTQFAGDALLRQQRFLAAKANSPG